MEGSLLILIPISVLLVLLFPQGLSGFVQMLWARLVPRKVQGAAA